MGKRFKIISITTVFVLYCFFLSIYGGTVVTSASFFSNATAQENFVSLNWPNDASHAEQAQSSFHIGKNIHRPSLKKSFNHFSFSSLAASGVLPNIYPLSFYLFYSENLFIRFSKTDIIFPFHNFW